MSNHASTPRNMKGELGEKGSCPVVYLGGALAPWVRTPRPELDRRASIDPYRILIACPRSPPPIQGFFLTHQKSFPSPTLDSSGCDMRRALLAAAGSQIFVIFSKTIPPPNPFPLVYLHLQSNWIPSRSRASTLNLQTWVVAVESSRYVFLLLPFLSVGGTCDGDAN